MRSNACRTQLLPVDAGSRTLRRPLRRYNCRARAQTRSGPSSSLPSTADQRIRVVGSLFVAGATLGPTLDGIHSAAGLLSYDAGRVDLGPLHTNAAVPLLLGTFYALLGLAHLAVSPPPDRQPLSGARTGSAAALAGRAALSFGVLAANLAASSVLFRSGASSAAIAAVLAPLAAANFLAFEQRTLAHLALAAAVAAAPLAELAFMLPQAQLWHYTRPDVFLTAGGVALPGLVSWVPLCYFFYVPAVGNLAAALAASEAADEQE